MLRRAHDFFDYELRAWDGPVGAVRDLYFDDLEWVVRYFVVEAGEWLGGRQVLLTPDALHEIDAEEGALLVKLSREQIANSPPLEGAEPLSREYEEALHEYYEWPFYWSGLTPAGLGVTGTYSPIPPANPELTAEAPGVEEGEGLQAGEHHLRSVREVSGYAIGAEDGDVGSVEDFVINDENWRLFYMIVETGGWLSPDREVLLAPTWVERIDWAEREVYVDLTRELIRKSPPFDPQELFGRDYEKRLYDHYGRRGYWMPDRSET